MRTAATRAVVSARNHEPFLLAGTLAASAVSGAVLTAAPLAVFGATLVALLGVLLVAFPVGGLSVVLLLRGPLSTIGDAFVFFAGSSYQVNVIGAQRVVVIACSVMILLGSRRRTDTATTKPVFAAPALLLVGVLAVMTAVSPERLAGTREWVTWAEPFALYFLITRVVRSWRLVRSILWTFLLAALVPLSIGLYQAVNPEVLRQFEVNSLGRIYSIGHHPNEYATYLVVVILVGFALWRTASSGRSRLIVGSVIGLAVVSLYFTFARAGWLGLLAGALVLACRRSQRRIILLFVAAMSAALVLIPSVRNDMLLRMSQQGSPEQHLRIDRYLLDTYMANPSGYGLGTTPEIILNTEGIWTTPHNDYLGLLTEGGPLALGLYLFLLLSVARRALHWSREHRKGPQVGELSIVLLALLAAYAVVGLTDAAVSYMGDFLWMAVGLAEVTFRSAGSVTDTPSISVGAACNHLR